MAPQAAVPEAGTYRMRLVKDGPWVPVRLDYAPTPDPHAPDNPMNRSPRWLVYINGSLSDRDGIEIWSWVAGNPITVAEYTWMVDYYAWACRHDPTSPQANPTEPIDLRTAPPPF